MTQAALALGFVFDRPICDDIGALQRLFELRLGGQQLGDLFEAQVLMPRTTGKVGRPTRFNWKRLSDAVSSGGTIYFSSRRDLPRPSQNRLDVQLECLAPDQLDSARASGEWPASELSYRYRGIVSIGTSFLEGNADVDRFLDQLLAQWMSTIELRTGVAAAYASFEEAEAYASGSARGLPGSELHRRTLALWNASWEWGRCAREPDWGTYLTRDHAEAVGGVMAIRSAVEPYRILEAGQVIFVQLTKYADALSPTADERRRKLLRLMEPIVAKPLSRD